MASPARALLSNPRLRRMFAGYRGRARSMLRDPQALEALATEARKQVTNSPSARIRELGDQIKRLGRLVRAYANGSYRDISAGNIAMVVGAILYFVTPLDLVPDAIPGAGLLDDATVFAFVLARLDLELERFAQWERRDAISLPVRSPS